MKTITQAKPKKKLSAFFDQFTDKGIKAENNATDKNNLKIVSPAFVSGHSFKNNDELAEIKTDYFHQILNRLIEKGITFDVSADDFQFIDGAQILKTSDREFLKINFSIILTQLQQSLLMKHLFNHSPEQLEDFCFEVAERECLNSPLRITAETRFEIYFEAVKSTTRKWFDELLKEKDIARQGFDNKNASVRQGK